MRYFSKGLSLFLAVMMLGTSLDLSAFAANTESAVIDVNAEEKEEENEASGNDFSGGGKKSTILIQRQTSKRDRVRKLMKWKKILIQM